MDAIGILGGLLTGGMSSVAGGVIGLIGTQLTKKNERLDSQNKREYELAIAKMDIERAEKELNQEILLAEKQIKKAEVEADRAKEVEEYQAFSKSLKVQTISAGNAIVDGVRGLMRPVITVYMMVMMSYIAYALSAAIGGFNALSPDVLMVMYRDAINQIFFLGATAMTWWFGSRPSSVRKDG